MTRRQALLALQLAPAGMVNWAKTTEWAKPFLLRVVLGGKDGISKLEVVSPGGETKTFTADELWEALTDGVSRPQDGEQP